MKPAGKKKWSNGGQPAVRGVLQSQQALAILRAVDPFHRLNFTAGTPKTLDGTAAQPIQWAFSMARIPIGILAGMHSAGGGFLLESLREHGAGASFGRPKPACKQGKVFAFRLGAGFASIAFGHPHAHFWADPNPVAYSAGRKTTGKERDASQSAQTCVINFVKKNKVKWFGFCYI